ncbi:MAG TPA: hypothetical protein VEH47_09015 [Candidatus Acidoferrales bacterium]|nr:hypothetical protein [Candidatus Acidoferrales bacterium]
MRSQRIVLCLVVVLVLGLAPFGFGQLASQPARTPHSYYNADTGQFETVRPMAETDAPVLVTPTTGTLTIKYTITVKTPMPKNSVISCTGSADVAETGFFADEDGSGIATGSGGTFTCSVVINYSWVLSTPAKDMVTLAGSVSIGYGYEITASNGPGTLVVAVVARHHEPDIAAIKVPTTASTTINVDVTL